jgi:hypothetical protein
MNTELVVSEETAAEMLGIRISEVKRLKRKLLLEGVDYLIDGKTIKISPDGLKKVSAAVRPLERKEVKALVVEIPSNPLRRDLVVDGTCPNPRILMAHFDDASGPVKVRVRVRDSRNFTKGMTVPDCRMVDETLYAFEGRLPRLRGRWM